MTKAAVSYKRKRSVAPSYVPPERRAKVANQYQQRLDDRRGLYGRKWSAYRKSFLARAENALCVACRSVGVIKAAEEVDHIVPHQGDPALFWDRTNHQALCKTCHSRKTASHDGGFGNRRRRP